MLDFVIERSINFTKKLCSGKSSIRREGTEADGWKQVLNYKEYSLADLEDENIGSRQDLIPNGIKEHIRKENVYSILPLMEWIIVIFNVFQNIFDTIIAIFTSN